MFATSKAAGDRLVADLKRIVESGSSPLLLSLGAVTVVLPHDNAVSVAYWTNIAIIVPSVIGSAVAVAIVAITVLAVRRTNKRNSIAPSKIIAQTFRVHDKHAEQNIKAFAIERRIVSARSQARLLARHGKSTSENLERRYSATRNVTGNNGGEDDEQRRESPKAAAKTDTGSRDELNNISKHIEGEHQSAEPTRLNRTSTTQQSFRIEYREETNKRQDIADPIGSPSVDRQSIEHQKNEAGAEGEPPRRRRRKKKASRQGTVGVSPNALPPLQRGSTGLLAGTLPPLRPSGSTKELPPL